MIKETDLSQPVVSLFEEAGFTVHCEVDDCDIVAVKQETVIIAELKTSFNLDLLMQLSERLERTDWVYAALPAQKTKSMRGKRWATAQKLLRRVGAGLIEVDQGVARVILEPGIDPVAVKRKKKNYLLKECASRSINLNTGGSVRVSKVTAYREDALLIATLLHQSEHPARPSELVASGAPKNTQAILYHNHYGWFIRAEKGRYTLQVPFEELKAAYSPLMPHIEKRMNVADQSTTDSPGLSISPVTPEGKPRKKASASARIRSKVSK